MFLNYSSLFGPEPVIGIGYSFHINFLYKKYHFTLTQKKVKTSVPPNRCFSMGIPLAFWMGLFLVGNINMLITSPHQCSLRRGTLPLTLTEWVLCNLPWRWCCPLLGTTVLSWREASRGRVWLLRGLYTTEHGLNTTDVKIEPPEGIASQQDLVHCLYKWISINNILTVDFEVRVNWKCKVNIFFKIKSQFC